MSEKLNLFEMTIKRGLENSEMPLDPNAWSQFEQNLGPTSGLVEPIAGGSSFLPKFAIAAVFLAGVTFFVNTVSSDSVNDSHEHLSELHDNTLSSNDVTAIPENEETHTATIITEDEASNSNDDEISASEKLAVDSDSEVAKASAELGEKEVERMNRIITKLHKESDGTKSSDDELKKRSTTRYLGKNFNLGALTSFSPNADGVKDHFLPSALKEGDVFKMTITNEAGMVLFQSEEVDKPWKGIDSTGTTLSEGRYSWEVVLQKDKNKEIFKGIVRLEL